MNEELMTLCRLNNVGLYCTANFDKVEWHACEAIVEEEYKVSIRSGFGESPEVAIADCKTKPFEVSKRTLRHETRNDLP